MLPAEGISGALAWESCLLWNLGAGMKKDEAWIKYASESRYGSLHQEAFVAGWDAAIAQPVQQVPQSAADTGLDQALSDYWDAAYAEGEAGATCDTYRTATDAWRDIKKRIDDNERWMSQAHIMCSDLGISQGHIEDRLFEALDRLHDLIRLKENLPDLLEYVEHDSWRCGYYDKCHCGLNDLTDKLGLERVPLPVKGENT